MTAARKPVTALAVVMGRGGAGRDVERDTQRGAEVELRTVRVLGELGAGGMRRRSDSGRAQNVATARLTVSGMAGKPQVAVRSATVSRRRVAGTSVQSGNSSRVIGCQSSRTRGCETQPDAVSVCSTEPSCCFSVTAVTAAAVADPRAGAGRRPGR